MKLDRRIKNVWLFFRLLAATGCVVVLFPDHTPAEQENAAGAEKVIAAKVNGEPILLKELDAQVDARLKAYRKFGVREKRPDLIRRLQLRALDKVVGDRLLHQESGKLKVENVEAKVDEKVKALERKYGAGERIDNYLKMRNLTMEGLRKSYKKRIQVDEYLKQQGVLEPEIPEERIKAAYDDNPDSYTTDETVHVSHVLIGFDPHADADEKAQARQEAERIRKEIFAGKDFAELAKKHSTCNSAAGGGVLKPLRKGYMPAEFDRVAFAMEKDAVSDVVETKFGYHIIKLSEMKPAGMVPYEKMRGFILKYLQQEESKTKLAAHLAELKGKAKIEILLPE